MATCGEVLVTLLERYGVEHVFGIPGVHTVELYRGLARSGIRHITPRHEQGAGFMADGYARTRGKPGVCFIITGPGMTNIATAMAQAYADSIPMLVISSVNPRNRLGAGHGDLHELPSQHKVVSGFAAFSHTLMSAAELPAVLARAFAVFQAARPRPVHIEIPLDVLVEPADALLEALPIQVPKPSASPSAIADAARRLAAARRPMILAGGGATNGGANLQRLAEALQAPVALTINAKGLLPPDHPLLVGSTQSTPATRQLVQQADVVLAVGTELGETDYDVVFDGGFRIPGELIRIDIDAVQAVQNFPPALAVVGDAACTLRALNAALSGLPMAPPDSDWGAARVARLRAEVAASLDPVSRSVTRFLQTVLDTLPDAVVVGDSTQPVYIGNLTIDPARPRSWFNASTGYGTLGYALPAAIGAQLGTQGGSQGHTSTDLAPPANRPVVCLIGDGGIQFTLGELASAVEARSPIIVLLWNNQGYEEIKKYMVNRDIEPVGVDIFTPDFVTVARGLGCEASRAGDAASLRDALLRASDRALPTLIEIDQATWMTGEIPC